MSKLSKRHRDSLVRWGEMRRLFALAYVVGLASGISVGVEMVRLFDGH
jgi:hypothetical protein